MNIVIDKVAIQDILEICDQTLGAYKYEKLHDYIF